MFHNFQSAIVGPKKKGVSIPYLTVRTLRDLNSVSFLKEYGFSTIREISFVTSGKKYLWYFHFKNFNS